MPDGSFSIVKEYYSYNEPVFLYFKSVTIEEMEDDGKDDDKDDKVIKELISYFAGTWTVPDKPENTIVLNEDGTIVYYGEKYKPEFYTRSDECLRAESRYLSIEFYKNKDTEYARNDYGYETYYYRDGTWSEISLNAENFFDFFEYKENFRIYRNAFGEWERAEISRRYTLKDEYKLLYGYEYKCGKNVAAKLSVDTYLTEYTIDFENETYTVATPGEFYETEIIDRESQYVVDLRISLPSIVLYPDDRDSVNKYYIENLIDATGTLYLSTNTDR